jgi:hypothetical protein
MLNYLLLCIWLHSLRFMVYKLNLVCSEVTSPQHFRLGDLYVKYENKEVFTEHEVWILMQAN